MDRPKSSSNWQWLFISKVDFILLQLLHLFSNRIRENRFVRNRERTTNLKAFAYPCNNVITAIRWNPVVLTSATRKHFFQVPEVHRPRWMGLYRLLLPGHEHFKLVVEIPCAVQGFISPAGTSIPSRMLVEPSQFTWQYDGTKRRAKFYLPFFVTSSEEQNYFKTWIFINQ